MNTSIQLLKHFVIARRYSTNVSHQKLFEILDDINKSKDNIKNITMVNWNTGFQNGHTLMFKFTNENNTYEGEILVRNIITNNNIDKLEIEYLKDKSIEFAKKN